MLDQGFGEVINEVTRALQKLRECCYSIVEKQMQMKEVDIIKACSNKKFIQLVTFLAQDEAFMTKEARKKDR